VTTTVDVVDIEAGSIAAIGGRLTFDDLSSEIYRRLDLIWPYVRANGFVTNHNVVAYVGDPHAADGADVEVGVQVDRRFDGTSPEGIRCTELPAGPMVRAVHVGPYDRLGETHMAVMAHCRDHDLAITGRSWEIYGDWTDDESQLETEVVYELAD
jgi:effector-binding domain-containing protein